jgi:hypothetical protein
MHEMALHPQDEMLNFSLSSKAPAAALTLC